MIHTLLSLTRILFVFLVPESVGEAISSAHESVLNHWQPFAIQLKGLHKAWDQWLFLILAEGNESVTRLHRELYSGIWRHITDGYRIRPDLGLGLFADKMPIMIFASTGVPLDVKVFPGIEKRSS